MRFLAVLLVAQASRRRNMPADAPSTSTPTHRVRRRVEDAAKSLKEALEIAESDVLKTALGSADEALRRCSEVVKKVLADEDKSARRAPTRGTFRG